MASWGWFFVGLLGSQLFYAVAHRQGFKQGFMTADKIWRAYTDAS